MKSLLFVIVLLAPAVALAAPPPEEESLRYVPPDVTFCLVVRDLRGHAEALGKSPFAEEFRRSPLAKALTGTGEVEQLAAAEKFLQKNLGLTFAQLRDDVLGDAVVFAYRPGPPGKPEQEEGLMTVRARDPKKLADLVERFNRYQKDVGDLKSIEEREHAGVKYFRRVEKGEEGYYCLRENVLIFSAQEGLLKQALTQDKKLRADEESPLGKRLRALGVGKAFLTFWVNPRGFDADLQARLEKAKGPEAAFLKTYLLFWKAVDDLAVTLTLGRDLEVGFSIQARPDALPASVRRFFDEAATPSDLWSRFPDDALLAMGARTHFPALFDLLAAFASKEGQQALHDELNRGLGTALGKDVAKDVLPHVGPDWGVCVTAPPRAGKAWFPSILFALRVGPGDRKDPIDRAALRSLHSSALLAALAFNRQRKDPIKIKSVNYDKMEVHYLASEGGAAWGLQPAFGMHDGYLLLGSTPETLKTFAATTPKKRDGDEVPLFRLSVKELRQYLRDRREPLSETLAEQHGLPAKLIGEQIDGLVSALEFLDRVEVGLRTSTGRATVNFRLKMTQSLRK